MALIDFFRINLPYGIFRNTKNEWFAFNREYVPLGWNSKENSKALDDYTDLPVYTKFKGLTEKRIEDIIAKVDRPSAIQRDDDGNIIRVFFYDDATNPQSNPKYWDRYFEIIKQLSKYQVG